MQSSLPSIDFRRGKFCSTPKSIQQTSVGPPPPLPLSSAVRIIMNYLSIENRAPNLDDAEIQIDELHREYISGWATEDHIRDRRI